MLDCIFIGHNDTDFESYEAQVRQLGDDSPFYRDLRLNYLVFGGRPKTFPQLYNEFRGTTTPFGICSILSPAVAYLASYVARRGFTFDWVNAFQHERLALAEKLHGDVRLVAITTTYYMSPGPVMEIVEFVREHNRSCKIVVGGPFIYSLYLAKAHNSFFRSIGADFYIAGQHGEEALARLLTALRGNGSLALIKNLAYRSGKQFVLNEVEVEVPDLDTNSVDWRTFASQIGGVASVRTAVSCPFSCSFCGFPSRGGKYRTTDVRQVERELDLLHNLGSVRSIQFIDDTFNIPPSRFKDLLRMMIRKNYGFTWNCQYRCQYADRETVSLMKESGCEGVFLGIEAANDDLLKAMNKDVTVEQYQRGLELLNEAEIASHANFIIGFPGETEKTFQDIKNFLTRAKPTFYRAQVWYCDPTTPVWEHREQLGIKGRGFQWDHKTMRSQTASEMVEDLFLNWNETTWTPQYNFEFYGVCQLINEGFSMTQAHSAIRHFNEGVREQLRKGKGMEVSAEVIASLRAALTESRSHEARAHTNRSGAFSERSKDDVSQSEASPTDRLSAPALVQLGRRPG